MTLDMALRSDHLAILPGLSGLPVRACRSGTHGLHQEWTDVVAANGEPIQVLFFPEATDEQRAAAVQIVKASSPRLRKLKERIDMTPQQERLVLAEMMKDFLRQRPNFAKDFGIAIDEDV